MDAAVGLSGCLTRGAPPFMTGLGELLLPPGVGAHPWPPCGAKIPARWEGWSGQPPRPSGPFTAWPTGPAVMLGRTRHRAALRGPTASPRSGSSASPGTPRVFRSVSGRDGVGGSGPGVQRSRHRGQGVQVRPTWVFVAPYVLRQERPALRGAVKGRAGGRVVGRGGDHPWPSPPPRRRLAARRWCGWRDDRERACRMPGSAVEPHASCRQ